MNINLDDHISAGPASVTFLQCLKINHALAMFRLELGPFSHYFVLKHWHFDMERFRLVYHLNLNKQKMEKGGTKKNSKFGKSCTDTGFSKVMHDFCFLSFHGL